VHRNLLNAAKEMLHRATEGEPDGYADGLIGVTDHQAAAIWLKAEINKAENK